MPSANGANGRDASRSVGFNLQHPKKRAFLAAFCEVATISAAAKVAGIARSTHGRWLASDNEYREAFAEVREVACDMLESEARRRATEGVRRLRFYRGEPIIDPETGEPYVEHEYSDTLLIFLLKGAMPEKYRERLQHEHRGLAESSRVRVIEDDDWYGNSDQIRAQASTNGHDNHNGPKHEL